MPPTGLSTPGETVTDPQEGLIRRARRSRSQPFVRDQITGKLRPPAAAFEPRLPETRPSARRFDKYLSVNIVSSLLGAGLDRDWQCDHQVFYAVIITAGACHHCFLSVTWEPVRCAADHTRDNPHHGGIRGVVELFSADQEQYDRVISSLAKASEILPESLAGGRSRPA